MNWKFTLPFAIVAVALVAIGGVATLRMGSDEATIPEGAAQPVARTAPQQAGVQVASKSAAAPAANTGDPLEDVAATVLSEGSADATVLSDASSDSAVVLSDSDALAGLSATYDASAF